MVPSVKNALIACGAEGAKASVRALVSLGSNIEPRRDYLARALESLAALPETRLVTVSPIEETDPVDVPAAYAGMRFLNQIAVLETKLGPYALSDGLHAIEDALGRIRTVTNGPRTLDLDLIDFGGLVLNDPMLTLPHPRAAGRAFVMDPIRRLGIAFWPDKATLRRTMKARRHAVTPTERLAASAAISRALSEHTVRETRPMAVYLASGDEITLEPFIRTALSHGQTLVAPRWDGSTYALCRLIGLAPEHLRQGPHGILEPRDCNRISPADMGLWAVPGLAFSRVGHRLGYGGGWFDRFLKDAAPDAARVGIAYPFQIIENIPHAEYDVAMTALAGVSQSDP